MAHKVRTHKWFNGILTFADQVFDSLEEAMGFAKSADADTVKVYNENDQVVHQQDNSAGNTYA
jgi:hypothetical protein